MEKTWNRWHTEGWVLTVVRKADGTFTYSVDQNGTALATALPASTLADAQHQAEDMVRNSTHRCTGPCSYWVSDTDDD